MSGSPSTSTAALELRNPRAAGLSIAFPVAELVVRGALSVQAGPPRRTLGVRRRPRYELVATGSPPPPGAPLRIVHQAVLAAGVGSAACDVRDVAKHLARERTAQTALDDVHAELSAAGLLARRERAVRSDVWERTAAGESVAAEMQAITKTTWKHERSEDPTPEQIAAAGVLADPPLLLALFDAWAGPGSGANDESRLLKHAGLAAPLTGRGDVDAAIRLVEEHLGTLDGLAALHALEGGAQDWYGALNAALPSSGGYDAGPATAGASA